MKTLSRLNSSILGEDSVSAALVDEFIGALQGDHAGELRVLERDFARTAIPHLDAEWLLAINTPVYERSAAQQAKANFSQTLIRELQDADYLVIGLPMVNFSLPSMLKAWNDHVARTGVTFRYAEDGPEGLLRHKTAFLIASMGGIHEPGKDDFLRPYMQHFLGFLGIETVHIATASGLSLGDDRRNEALVEARAEIQAWLDELSHEDSNREQAA